MELELRPAAPGDVVAAVPLIYSSGPDAFEYVFADAAKGMAQDFLRYAFLKGPGEFGYRNHLVAELDGEVVGTASAYGGDTSTAFMFAAMRQILAFYGLARGMSVIRRGLAIEKVVQPPKGAVHYIAHVGVAPEHRGKGIGAKLVNQLLEQGNALGRTTAALDVSVENPRAEALYERLGFRTVREVESTLANRFGKVVNHRRMELPL